MQRVGDLVDDLHAVLLGQLGHLQVPAAAVGLCIVLIGHPRYAPLLEELGEDVLRLAPHHKQPGRET